MIAKSVVIELMTLATRPKARAAAQNPAISWSAGSGNGRTRFTGSVADASRLKSWYSASRRGASAGPATSEPRDRLARGAHRARLRRVVLGRLVLDQRMVRHT